MPLQTCKTGRCFLWFSAAGSGDAGCLFVWGGRRFANGVFSARAFSILRVKWDSGIHIAGLTVYAIQEDTREKRMNRFVIAEPDKCIGCRTCEVACVLAHKEGKQEGVALSAENFHPRLRLVKNLTLTAPVQCRQCENAPCVNVCPTGALVYDRNTVQIRQERCIGCQSCVIACPFGAMAMVDAPVRQPELGPLQVKKTVSVAQKCDLCIDKETGPACVAVCPTHALHLVDMEDIDNKTRRKREKSAFAMPADAFK